MPALTTEQRIARLEERQEALDMAFMAVMASDQVTAEDEGRDSTGSMAEGCLGPLDYDLSQSEKVGDVNPRLRRIVRRAQWLLAGKPYTPID